ncbi:MAG: DUF4278 domain-containing protein [Microcoleaceae cyanobacterium]
MTLRYRHISYEPDCSGIDCVEGEVRGRYRGQEWHVHYPRHIHVPPSPRQPLRYRGVTYNLNQLSDQASPAVGITPPKPQPKTPSVIPRGAACEDEWQQVHKGNVCRVLEHRRQQAEAKGDQQLLDSLNSEAQHWAC